MFAGAGTWPIFSAFMLAAEPSNCTATVGSGGGSGGLTVGSPSSKAASNRRCTPTEIAAERFIRPVMSANAPACQPRPDRFGAVGEAVGAECGALAAFGAGTEGAEAGELPDGCSASRATLVNPPCVMVPITCMIRP